jgi:hypothetical protein
MIADYLRHLGNPIAFAKDYYQHLPRVALGHWPPFFEGTQALVFLIFGSSNAVTIGLQAIIAGLLAGLPAAFVTHKLGWFYGALTGLLIFCNPVVLFAIDTVMADNLLAVLVLASAWTWSMFFERRTYGWAAICAATFIAAMLTKGTAIPLLVLPLVFAVWYRDFALLFDRRSLLALAAILIFTVPWYRLTYHLVAAGMNYTWGWDYTRQAIPYFAKSFISDFGIPCAIGFFYGTWRVARSAASGETELRAFAATAIILFIAAVIMPADLQARYLIPVYACAAIVSVWGIAEFVGDYFPRQRRVAAEKLIFAAAVVGISIWQGFAPPHVESFRTNDAVATIEPQKVNPYVLVSGSARFEGAVVASFAQKDHAHYFYALRASKLLSSSDFMGKSFEERFASEDELRAWLKTSGIGWVVVDTSPDSLNMKHNANLLSVVRSNNDDFHLVWGVWRPDGLTLVFRTAATATTSDQANDLLARQSISGSL